GGFGSLSPGRQARSMASLVYAGLLHPQPLNFKDEGDKSIQNPYLSTITWGPVVNMSQSPGSNEPAAAMHPTNHLLALAAGNGLSVPRVNNTSNGGTSWASRDAPSCGTYQHGAVAWLASTFNSGNSAIFVGLCNVSGAGQLAII